MKYTTQQRVFSVKLYLKYKSVGRCLRKFRCRFPGETVHSKQINLWLSFVGSLKDKAYKTNPRWSKLRSITTTSQQFPDLDSRVNNMSRRYAECNRSGHHHFQHLLQHGRVFNRLSKGYYHCDTLCSSLNPLLRFRDAAYDTRAAEGAPTVSR
jgi:hypothetical protein